MSADQPEIRRLDVGDGIYLRVDQPDAPRASTDAPSAPAPAWTIRPAAVAAATGLAAVAVVRLGVNPHGLLAAGLLALLVVLASIDLQARILPNRIVLPATGVVLAWQFVFFPD